jgi:hypothetical protein
MKKSSMEAVQFDQDKLAESIESAEAQRLVQFSFRVPAAKHKAIKDVARRRYGTSAQRLMNAVIDQILAENS